jgi:MFS family permease
LRGRAGNPRDPLEARSSIIPFLAAAFIMDLCVVTVRTTVPLQAESMSASPFAVGMIATTMSIVYTAMALFFGRLSDRIGRTPIVLSSFLFYALGALLLSKASALWQLFALMGLIGLGMGMFWPIIEAWIADSEGPDHSRSISTFCLAWSGGAMIGPVAAGFLLGEELAFGRTLGAVVLFTAISFLVLVLTKSRERERQAELRSFPDEEPVPAWIFISGLLALLACWMIQSTSYTFFPLIASSRGIRPESMGLILFAMGGSRTLVFLLLFRYRARGRSLGMIRAALVLACIGCLLFLFVDAEWAFAPALFTFGLAIGIVYILGLRLAVTGSQGRGSRTGLFEAVIGIGALASPLGSGVLANIQLNYAFAFNLASLVAVLLAIEGIHLRLKR